MEKPKEEHKISTRNQSDNWSGAVEDLAAAGDSDTAISLLESVVVSELQAKNTTGSDPQLGSALTDLAKLYSSKGFSLALHSSTAALKGVLEELEATT